MIYAIRYAGVFVDEVIFKPFHLILPLAFPYNLKVQVLAIGSASRTHVPYNLAAIDVLSLLNQNTGHMRIPRLKKAALEIAMVQPNHVAVRLHTGFGLAVPIL